MPDSKPQLVLGRPKDKSLAAFKAWARNFGKALAGDGFEDDMTEAEWKSEWQAFWADEAAPKSKAA